MNLAPVVSAHTVIAGSLASVTGRAEHLGAALKGSGAESITAEQAHVRNDPHIRHRVQMPDGKHVEVTYRDHRHAPRPAYAPEPSTRRIDRRVDPEFTADPACPPQELHVCFHCAGELVYPLDWSEEGPRHWRIVLRCPECESRREGVFDQAAVERLDDELDRGVERAARATCGA